MPLNMNFNNARVWVSGHKATLCHIGAGVAAVILLTVGISNCSGKKKAVSERDNAYNRVEKADSINKVMYKRLLDCGNKSDSLTYVIGEKDLIIEDLTNKNDSLVIANDSLQAGWDNCRAGIKTVTPRRPVSSKPVQPKPVQPTQPKPVQPTQPKPVQPKPVQPVQPKPVQPVQPRPVTPSNVPSGVTVNINAGANVQTVFGNVTNNYNCKDSMKTEKADDVPIPVIRQTRTVTNTQKTILLDTLRQR